MVFWTVVFITYYLATLSRGNLYYNIIQKVGLLTIKQAETESKVEKKKIGEEILKSSWLMFLAIPLIIVEYIYLFKAISIDIYKYPSIVMLFYILLSTFVLNKSTKSKVDLTTEEGRIRYKIELEKQKRYSFKGTISNLGFLTYFGYMFWMLVLR